MNKLKAVEIGGVEGSHRGSRPRCMDRVWHYVFGADPNSDHVRLADSVALVLKRPLSRLPSKGVAIYFDSWHLEK